MERSAELGVMRAEAAISARLRACFPTLNAPSTANAFSTDWLNIGSCVAELTLRVTVWRGDTLRERKYSINEWMTALTMASRALSCQACSSGGCCEPLPAAAPCAPPPWDSE